MTIRSLAGALALTLAVSPLAGQSSEPAVAPAAPTAEAPTAPFDQTAALETLRAAIAGHEQEPSETVFKNIHSLAGVPAGRLLAIMEFGYSRSLGVTCVHCHTPANWSADDKPEKEITRAMGTLTRELNQKLQAMPGLATRKPAVNCTTCHRGQIKPALDLDDARP